MKYKHICLYYGQCITFHKYDGFSIKKTPILESFTELDIKLGWITLNITWRK